MACARVASPLWVVRGAVLAGHVVVGRTLMPRFHSDRPRACAAPAPVRARATRACMIRVTRRHACTLPSAHAEHCWPVVVLAVVLLASRGEAATCGERE